MANRDSHARSNSENWKVCADDDDGDGGWVMMMLMMVVKVMVLV